ncbi:MAG TPA: hypothetical protein VF065_06820 [Ilumatobacter sp.]
MTEEIHEGIVETEAAQPPAPQRKKTRGIAVASAAILVAGIVAAVAVVQDGGDAPQPDITAAPANPSSDAAVRSLVERGVVPAASLDDGSQVVGRRLATPSQDDVVRVLVERGLVPAASLDDGSQVANPSAARSQDEIVRDLVERGLVPAATLADGSEVTG